VFEKSVGLWQNTKNLNIFKQETFSSFDRFIIFMKKFSRFSVIFFCFGVFFFQVGLAPVASAITISREEEMAKEFLKTVFEKVKLVEDPMVQDYVNHVGNRIVSSLSSQVFSYHFYVIKEDVYNAFASPAGHIFVNSGLLAAMENEEELAGILAHEIAHVLCRHISQRIERSKKIGYATLAGLIASVLVGAGGSSSAGSALGVGSMAAGQSMALAFSREDEMQADQLGMECLRKAGYTGAGLLSVLGKIRSKQWFGTQQIPT
jgi:predicted Zn-dependent protease